MKKIIIATIIMFMCFALSLMFFLNSGIVDGDTGHINPDRAMEVMMQFDKIPLLNIGADSEKLDNYRNG